MRGLRIGLALMAAVFLYAAGTNPHAQAENGAGRHRLTKRGQFQQAPPHFLAARGHVAEDFALEFNLALCYVGTRQFPQAIQILTHIGGGRHRAEVDNLLAQAFVGDHQQEEALKALERAADASPKDERLYLLVSEACLDEGLYDLGIQCSQWACET